MKMKIKTLEKGPMILTGSKVLKAIMDNSTPPIDLFVREAIQNSADAILSSKTFGKIKFTINTFSNSDLLDALPSISSRIYKIHNLDKYSFVSVSDSNTCGLLGLPVKSDERAPNNLYNLVYDFMNTKEGETFGGSWGIGKSVYYRYGNGICFYYTRTFENGKYCSKLAGALIQNENSEDCFLGEKSSGIAYFGEIEENKSIPIYDEERINEFLSIFGLSPYINDETGTTVIIPYLNEDEFLKSNNDDEDIRRYWLSDASSSLKMAIQRWYFPRLNNKQYNGQFLKVTVNNVMIELCDFYKTLQELYNGSVDGCKKKKINSRAFGSTNILGDFNYKLFSKEELDVLTPPNNNPEPKFFVDSNGNCDEEGLLFYTRKPGMILNYDNKEFGIYDVEEGKYLIGIFILNDDLNIQGEQLGTYIRKTEKSNHISWGNDTFEEFSFFSKKKPFKKISSGIKTILNEEFNNNRATTLEGSATILQKKYGEKLLPPSDFGNQASIPTKTAGKTNVSRKRKTIISFSGMNDKGYLIYNIEFFLLPHECFIFRLNIKAGAKTFDFGTWEEMDFVFPCELSRIDVAEFYINHTKYSNPQNISLDDGFEKKRKKVMGDKDIYKIKGIKTQGGIPLGFALSNPMEDNLTVIMRIQIRPINNKYQISFSSTFRKEDNNEY